MSCRNYRIREAVLQGKNLKADGMLEMGALERRAFENRLEASRIEAKLEEQMFAPIGRLLSADEDAKRAAQTLREQTMARVNQQVAQFQTPPPPPRRGPGFIIYPGQGCSSAPWDGTWADKYGNCLATADKSTGLVNTSLGMPSGTSQWAEASLLVWVVPTFADDILVISANQHVGYNWTVKTSWGPTAHSNGRLQTLIVAHDGSGGTTKLVERNDFLWNVGSSGISDEQSGSDDFWRSPSYTVSGGQYYEVWLGVLNEADASSATVIGWAAAWAHLWMTLTEVCVKFCDCH
jgi:hypothetical protein